MTSPFDPIEAVILAIDPGKTSGWAIYSHDRCIASGTAKTHAERVAAIDTALAEEVLSGRRLIVVAEKWTPGGKFAGARTMAGLGAQWGLWLAALEACKVPRSRIVRVHTQTWRAKVLGGGWGVKSEEWDERAKRFATATTGVDAGDDQNDAICLGAYACRAPIVAAMLLTASKRPRKHRKRRSDLGVRRVAKREC